MKWVEPSVSLLTDDTSPETLIYKCEYAARNCYQSHDKMGPGSGEKLLRNCIKRGHESVLEHASVSFVVVCDRGVSHEVVRHRLASYSQESTRYCNYSLDKYDNTLSFVYPWWAAKAERALELSRSGEIIPEEERKWAIAWTQLCETCWQAELSYQRLTEQGVPPDAARAVLPNCLKTKIVCTMNMREIRHFIKLRASAAAHPDIRVIAKLLYDRLIEFGLGVFIDDIEIQ